MTKERLLKVWDISIIALSFYTILEFLLELVIKIPQYTVDVLDTVDFVLCILFFADWLGYFLASTEKKKYFWTHLLDLISSIPFLQIVKPLRVARAIRVVRLVRLVRGFRGAERFIKIFTKSRARSAMSLYIVITILIYFYGTIGVYNFEVGINKNVSTFGDAMWMCFTTLTTVGYGDCYPITAGGRILCAILVITGMGLFSLFTAEFATFILKEVKQAKQ